VAEAGTDFDEWADDARRAARLAERAGAVLMALRDGALSGRALGDAGDRAAQVVLADRLRAEVPDDPVLSEEAPDDERRLGRPRVWIVDPLDGTREFGEPGRSDWAVHVALAVDGVAVAGAVALPAQGLVHSSVSPPARPAWTGRGAPRIVVSRTRPPWWVAELARSLGAELVPMGSAGAKAMAVAGGTAEAYVHAGGMHEWDAAAPVVVAQAAGLVVTRLDGSPVRFNQRVPRVDDLLMCVPELAARLAEGVGRVSGAR
jgi:3'(2'), 5'-bisphosphate nucleotidase